MANGKLLMLTLAGTVLATTEAYAGGPSGGGAANCLCRVVTGALSGNSVGRPNVGMPQVNLIGGAQGGRTIGAHDGAGIGRALDVTIVRSTAGRSGRAGSNIGLAGKVSGSANALINVGGVGRSVGLAGKPSTHASTSGRIHQPATGLGGSHGKSMAGQVTGIANVSVLNQTGPRGRSLANVSALNGTGGTSGKVANVAVLNRTGTTGRSLVNASVLNGSAGGTGRVANVAVLNGRHGNGNGKGGLGLPSGIQIINGVPCGPDGTPLTGSAKATVMAMISSNGGHGGGSGSGKGSGSTGSPDAGSSGSQGGQAGPTGQSRERDKADRTDLWWPQHTEGSYREGRLNDH